MVSATELWGVGCYDGEHTRIAWEISHAEIQRDIGSAAATLRGLGIGPGARVLFCSKLSEAGQFWPLIVGTMLSGAQLSCADATESDAGRVAMFTRLLAYRAVFGVDEAVLDGLDALERPYADVFGDVMIIGARPGAMARLAAAGLAPAHFVLCGPAVAVAPEPHAPARVDADEWEVDADDGRIVVTALRARATRFVRAPTAVMGAIVDGGVMPEVT